MMNSHLLNPYSFNLEVPNIEITFNEVMEFLIVSNVSQSVWDTTKTVKPILITEVSYLF